MIVKPNSSRVAGLAFDGDTLLVAVAEKGKEGPTIALLSSADDVKPLDLQEVGQTDTTLFAFATSSAGELVRSLKLPVKGESKIAPLVPFEAEPLLPFPSEEALLDWQLTGEDEEKSHLSLLAMRQEVLSEQLTLLGSHSVDPEAVTFSSAALAQYAHHEAPTQAAQVVLYIGEGHSIAVLAKEGALLTAHHIGAGSKSKTLKQKIQQALVALKKGVKQEIASEILLVGLSDVDLPSLEVVKPENGRHAIAIGTALSYLDGASSCVNMRQGELTYDSPFRRYQRPALLYLSLALALAITAWLAGHEWLDRKETTLKTEYYSLLTALNKTPDQVDQELEKSIGFTPPLNAYGIETRALRLEEELRNQADTFPLQPNLPRVSDLLAWLSAHPEVTNDGAGGVVIQSLNYTMAKRPEATNKRQRYQVRVEIEFTADTPRLARELRDALQEPNPFVDNATDLKWNVTGGKYKATFFLKDRTAYLTKNHGGTHHVA